MGAIAEAVLNGARGTARGYKHEFARLQGVVQTLLNEGYTQRAVFDALRTSERIGFSFRTFTRYLAEFQTLSAVGLSVYEDGLRRMRELLAGKEPSRWSKFQRLWSEVAELIEQRLTIKAIYEGLVEHAGWRGGYDMFRRYVHKMTKGVTGLKRVATAAGSAVKRAATVISRVHPPSHAAAGHSASAAPAGHKATQKPTDSRAHAEAAATAAVPEKFRHLVELRKRSPLMEEPWRKPFKYTPSARTEDLF